MVNLIAAKLLVLGASLRLAAALSVQLSSHDGGRSLVFTQDGMTVENTIHAGPSRTALSVVPVHRLLRRQVVGAGPSAGSSGPRIQWQNLSPDTVRVTIESDGPVTGASFSWGSTDQFFGIWEYPFNGSVANDDISFEVKGLIGDQVGVNYANARAPFFFTRSGFGVYVDTLKMGRFDFKRPNKANFTFDTTALTYTVMYRPTPKELLSQYMNMSSRPDIPIDSGYGPIFWSDDMTKDFHGSVKNAQENYYDIVDHLYYNKIRATGMFADREWSSSVMSCA